MGGFRARLWLGWMALAVALIAQGIHAEEDASAPLHYPEKIADDAPKPLSAKESLQAFSLPEGFEIECVASEPLIADPVSITFDAQGRLFVVELYGYNLEGQLDTEELNKAGVVDRQVRRFHVDQALAEKAQKQIFSRIKRLEDRDGDGVMDHTVIWADRLPPCHGIVAAGEKIIVVCAPDVVSLEDTDGDGEADHRETIFTGFGVGELWTRINSPRWGIDNWIYVGAGQRCGGVITGPHLKTPVRLGNTSFRFKPDGSAIEPAAGAASGYGHTFNDWGHRFALTNQQHAMTVSPIEPRYARRNPYLILPRADKNISSYGHPAELFPLSDPHPWRTLRASDPKYVKLYGESETTAGLVTSACAPVIYRADQFPEEYYGIHFSCEPAQNLIHACRLMPDGLGYRAERLLPNREFLASTDVWFRPVSLVLGPDGALYVADMYREIIEDYSAVPRYLQQRYGLMNGSDRGRIWRIAAKSPTRKQPPVASLDTQGLVATLRDANAWRREQAQYLLVSQHDGEAYQPLRAMATQDELPTARTQALFTLDGLDQLDEETLLKALNDDSAPVRAAAVRLSELKLDECPSLRERVVSMVRDEDAHVRLQALLSLGQCSSPEVIREIGRSALRAGDDDLIVTAVFCRPPADVRAILLELLSRGTDLPDDSWPTRKRLIRLACRIVTSERDAEQIAPVLKALSEWANEGNDMIVEGLRGMMDGLGKNPLDPSKAVAGQMQPSLALLATAKHPEVQRLLSRLTSALGANDVSSSRESQEALVKTVLDERSAPQQRVEALESLSGCDVDLLARVADEALRIHQPMSLQQAVIDELDRRSDPSSIAFALARWSDFSPSVQNSAIEMAFRRAERLPGLLEAIERGQVPARMLAGVYRERLLEHADATIRSRAKKLLSGQSDEGKDEGKEDERLEHFAKALDRPTNGHDGGALFKKNCAICHRLAGEGGTVGPDLSAVHKQPPESILKDILRPSEKITAGFLAYLAETADGQVFIGIVSSESDNSITLQLASGQSMTLLRKELADLKPLKQSLMPDNFSEVLTPQDAAAIIGHLQNQTDSKQAAKTP